MLKNYIKIAKRMMVKDKTYTITNVLGLTLGLSACMLVMTVVIDDLSYDKFWKRSDDIYRILSIDNQIDLSIDKHASTPAGIGSALVNHFPEVEQHAAVRSAVLQLRTDERNPDGVTVQAILADSTITDLFDFHFVSGHPPAFLAGQSNVYITERFRDKYFNGQDPIGKVIYDVPTLQEEKKSYVITAVIKNIPPNTHLRAEAVVLNQPRRRQLNKNGYGLYLQQYVLLKPGADPFAVTRKLNQWYAEFMEFDNNHPPSFELQPLQEIYLRSDFDYQLAVKGNIQSIYIFSAVGLLLLLIACINFINLSTANAFKRLKETGIRKILGANRKHVTMQFLTESLLFFSFSTLLAFVLYLFALPSLQSFLGHGLANKLVSQWPIFISTLLCIYSISIITGIYPAWLIAGFKPINSLKDKRPASLFAPNWIRQGLVVTQYTIAIVVLVALVVISKQLNFLNNKELGYDKENLLYIGRRSFEGKAEVFKTELKKISGVEAASVAGWIPAMGGTLTSRNIDNPFNEDKQFTVNIIVTDFDFAKTMGIRLHRGRWLNKAYTNDSYDYDLANEMGELERETYNNTVSAIATRTTANMLGIDTLGHTVKGLGYRIVGIIEDFHHESLYHKLSPTLIIVEKGHETDNLFIRTTPGSKKQVMPAITKLWRQFYPDKYLDAVWVSDITKQHYEPAQKQQALFMVFSGLTLFISGLGVLGLVIHNLERRVKEIGIRKVLGASVAGIVRLLSGDYLKLVLVALFFATPLAWWLMNQWLQDFAYRVEITWWMFVVAGLVAVIIALLTVGWQAIRAAVANPVDSLRDE